MVEATEGEMEATMVVAMVEMEGVKEVGETGAAMAAAMVVKVVVETEGA